MKNQTIASVQSQKKSASIVKRLENDKKYQKEKRNHKKIEVETNKKIENDKNLRDEIEFLKKQISTLSKAGKPNTITIPR